LRLSLFERLDDVHLLGVVVVQVMVLQPHLDMEYEWVVSFFEVEDRTKLCPGNQKRHRTTISSDSGMVWVT
jgi:hypothetical protein